MRFSLCEVVCHSIFVFVHQLWFGDQSPVCVVVTIPAQQHQVENVVDVVLFTVVFKSYQSPAVDVVDVMTCPVAPFTWIVGVLFPYPKKLCVHFYMFLHSK